jgi:hypothetical protein
MTPKTAEDRLRYARQFGYVMAQGGDASELLRIPPNRRIHIMKSLSCLARYTGQYNSWRSIIEQYQLSWSTGTEKIDAFQRFFDSSKDLDTMIGWLREAIQTLPGDYANFFLFCTLTSMRCTECLASVRLIKNPETFKTYYDPVAYILRHYLYPHTFIRRTKAIFMSIADWEIIKVAQKIQKIPTPDSLKMVIRGMCPRLEMRIKYCRKINNSWLRQQGIQPEIINMLSGRVGKDIFLRNYYVPSLQYKEDVLRALHRLKERIES